MNVIEDLNLWREFIYRHDPDTDCGHCSCGWVEFGDARDRVYVMDHFREVLLEAMSSE